MPCVSCCSYPNGYITIAPGLLSVVAFILTHISLWSCQYAGTDIGVGVGLIYREVVEPVWFYSVSSDGTQCTSYASYSDQYYDALDGKFRAAQGCGLAAWMVGFVMVVVVWSVAPCVVSSRAGWRIIGGMFFLLGVLQLFTLLLLASDVCQITGCKLNNGGVVSIFSFLFWWASAGTCFMVPEPREEPGLPRVAPPRPVAELVPTASVMAAETTTQRVEVDGSIVTETIKTNPDGSFTVTTSKIPPAAAAAPAVVAVATPDTSFEKR